MLVHSYQHIYLDITATVAGFKRVMFSSYAADGVIHQAFLSAGQYRRVNTTLMRSSTEGE